MDITHFAVIRAQKKSYCYSWVSAILTLVKTDLFIGYRLNMAKYARPRSLSGTADRACEVCFCSKTKGGHISPYSVYNLFITYSSPEFIFCKLSYCNLKYLKCSTLSALRLIRLGSRRVFVNSKQQANIAGKRCLHTGINRPLMATANAVHDLFVVVVSIYLHHLRHLYVFRTIQCY